jgi:hypothetical protein
MKKFGLLSVIVLVLATLGFGQALTNYNMGGVYQANAYGSYTLKLTSAVVAGSASATVDVGNGSGCSVSSSGLGGVKFQPIFNNNQLTFLDSNSETVTISAVSGCTFTATFSNNHPVGSMVMSGTFGVGEAINAAKSTGGVVRVGSDFGGSASTITGFTGGASNVFVQALTSGGEVDYSYNGSGYTAIPGPTLGVTANGAAMVPFVNSELLTLSTGGTTTDTTANLLPANSIVLGVSGRVTTTITSGCTGWQLGDPTTAGRFTASDTTLTAGEAKVGSVQLTTGVASATTGMFQTSAAKVRVTCATAAPGAGAVRITVFGYTLTAPQN